MSDHNREAADREEETRTDADEESSADADDEQTRTDADGEATGEEEFDEEDLDEGESNQYGGGPQEMDAVEQTERVQGDEDAEEEGERAADSESGGADTADAEAEE